MVETTSQANGYPSNLKYAYIGFETFEQAEEFANKFNMELAILDKHNGWQLWHRGNTAWEAFHIDSNDYGDNYCHFRASDAENFYEENVKPCLEEFDSFEGLEEFIKKL